MKSRLSWLLISLAALLAFPAVASAAPVPFDQTFDEARLQLNNGVVDEEGGASSFTGTIDDVTGDVTIPQDGVDIAQFTTSTGAPVIAQPNEPFTGNYDDATGEFSIGGNVNVLVPTSQTGGCVFPGLQLDFSTSNAAPSGDFSGSPFTNGLDGAEGSIVAAWQDLPQGSAYGTGDPAQCTTLNALANGPGALQIGNDLTPEPPLNPALIAKSKPGKATIKQGKAKVFKVNVRTKDGDGPAKVRVCTSSQRGVGPVGEDCKVVKGVTAEGKVVKVKVKAKKNAKPGKYTVKFKAKSDGYKNDTATSKVTVKKRG